MALNITKEVIIMLNNNTITKLHELKLNSMAQAFKDQIKDNTFSSMTFEERFGLIIDIEWNKRKNSRLLRLIKSAEYTFNNACVEDIEYHQDRELDKTLIIRLSTCNYIQENHNVVIFGATGSGKTYISNALGISANRNFYTVKYVRLPDLLNEIAIARGEGNYRKLIKKYAQTKLLIIDEWLLFQLKETEARDLLEIIESRYKKASTIFCSQIEVEGWHKKINYPTIADAICDRIVHDSYWIIIRGKDSMRKRKGIHNK